MMTMLTMICMYVYLTQNSKFFTCRPETRTIGGVRLSLSPRSELYNEPKNTFLACQVREIAIPPIFGFSRPTPYGFGVWGSSPIKVQTGPRDLSNEPKNTSLGLQEASKITLQKYLWFMVYGYGLSVLLYLVLTAGPLFERGDMISLGLFRVGGPCQAPNSK